MNLVFLPLAFICLLLFGGLWVAIGMLLSSLSGWRRLARAFPAKASPAGTYFPMQGGRVGRVRYRGVLNIHSSPEGLYLSVLFLFRAGHPPLFLPWNTIRAKQVHRFFGFESLEVEVGTPPIATLLLPRKVFAHIEAAPALNTTAA